MTRPEGAEALLKAIQERRSIRGYTDEPVTSEEIEKIITAGIWAPSGLNNQPWRFLVVRGDDPRAELLADCTKYAHIVRAAPVLIAVFLDKTAMYHEMKDHQAAGSAIQNMLLAVHALGLGAVWLGEIYNHEAKVLDALKLDPEAYSFQALLAVGRPDREGSSSRKPLDHFLIEPIP